MSTPGSRFGGGASPMSPMKPGAPSKARKRPSVSSTNTCAVTAPPEVHPAPVGLPASAAFGGTIFTDEFDPERK
jgi:hypothetical protein